MKSRQSLPFYSPFHWLFLVALCTPLGIRVTLLLEQDLGSMRLWKNFSLGVGYDLMNSSALTFLVLILPFSTRILRWVMAMVGVIYCFFSFVDYQYVQQFGTHLPFSTLEYLKTVSQFQSSIWSTLGSVSFFLIFLLPSFLLLWKVFRTPFSADAGFLRFGKRVLSVLILVVVGGVSGSYSNSYVSKNREDPIVSAGLNYFFWTQEREQEIAIERPSDAIEQVVATLSGESATFVNEDYPLVRTHIARACPVQKTPLQQALCPLVGKPVNVLLVVLESFRGAEVGALGSSLKLTPRFDEWSQRGILFTNFFANGFQTRHGEVALYCSLMPNYGAAIMKRYAHNHFRCLPEILQESGFSTSWVHASDAGFDGQISFLKKIGFSQIIDSFDFPRDTEKLGWGYSDEALFEKWLELLEDEVQPFFSSALTITNHHPFAVPSAYELDLGHESFHQFYNSMYYTDAQLGAFLDMAREQSWYEQTLILITADTSSFLPSEVSTKNFEEFVQLRSRVPLLMVGGVIQTSQVIEEYYSQIDLAPTIMHLLNLNWTSHWAGNSMLFSEETTKAFTNRPGAYWAVMSTQGRYYREHGKKTHLFGFAKPTDAQFYQRLGEAWLQTSRWLLQEDRYWSPSIRRSDAD